jgi:hypothetical protein
MNDLRARHLQQRAGAARRLYRDVVPVARLIEQTFQAQLIDPEPAWLDRFVAFDLTDKLKGDPVQLAQSLKLQVEAGITRNEARDASRTCRRWRPAATLTMNVNNQAPPR